MRSRLLATVAVAVLSIAALAGCAPGATSASSESPDAGSGGWPRTIPHDAGEAKIASKPVRIVSVSPSITGSLLAIGAPVVASAATTPSGLTDDKGFFTQWAAVADERNVEVAYGDLELDLDAVDLLEPDLIVGSVNGGDATLDAYDQLSQIAPTVMLDYGTATWQGLTTELGAIVGLEDAAAATIADYDAWVAKQAGALSLPPQPVTAGVYLGADGIWAFDETSPQAELLTKLGFTYQPANSSVSTERAGANGVDVLSAENMSTGLAGAQTLFFVAMAGPDPVAAVVADPLLTNQPAVAAREVHSLGSEAFRLDYFSAKNTVELIVASFPA